MSSGAPVRVRERMFWAWDDALAVWLAHLVEEIRAQPETPQWLEFLAADWAVAAGFADFGVHWDDPDEDQLRVMSQIAAGATARARSGGDVTAERLRSWEILEGMRVAEGFGGELVELDRVLEIAGGFSALLTGRFPPDPPGGRQWFLGTGEGPLPTDRPGG